MRDSFLARNQFDTFGNLVFFELLSAGTVPRLFLRLGVVIALGLCVE